LYYRTGKMFGLYKKSNLLSSTRFLAKLAQISTIRWNEIRPQEDEMMLNTDVKQWHAASEDILPLRSVPCRGPQPTPEPSPPDRSHSAPAHKQDKMFAKRSSAKGKVI
jgi:hypothetical protein